MFSLSRLYQIIPIEKSHRFCQIITLFAKNVNFQHLSSLQIHPLLSPSVVFFHPFPFLFRFFPIFAPAFRPKKRLADILLK